MFKSQLKSSSAHIGRTGRKSDRLERDCGEDWKQQKNKAKDYHASLNTPWQPTGSNT